MKIMSENREDTLKYSTYAIAVFDLLSSVFFSAVSIHMLMLSAIWMSFVALLVSSFWASVVVLLIIGIIKRRPQFVRTWITFSCCGIFLRACLLSYGLYKTANIDPERIKGVSLLYIGLLVESVFVFIVYRLYKDVNGETTSQQKSTFWKCLFSRNEQKKTKEKPKSTHIEGTSMPKTRSRSNKVKSKKKANPKYKSLPKGDTIAVKPTMQAK